MWYKLRAANADLSLCSKWRWELLQRGKTEPPPNLKWRELLVKDALHIHLAPDDQCMKGGRHSVAVWISAWRAGTTSCLLDQCRRAGGTQLLAGSVPEGTQLLAGSVHEATQLLDGSVHEATQLLDGSVHEGLKGLSCWLDQCMKGWRHSVAGWISVHEGLEALSSWLDQCMKGWRHSVAG